MFDILNIFRKKTRSYCYYMSTASHFYGLSGCSVTLYKIDKESMANIFITDELNPISQNQFNSIRKLTKNSTVVRIGSNGQIKEEINND